MHFYDNDPDVDEIHKVIGMIEWKKVTWQTGLYK